MYLTAYFHDRGVPKTGLTPAITVRRVSTGAVLVNAQPMTEVGNGFYQYDYASYDRAIEIVFICDGGVSLADPDRYSVGSNRDDLSREAEGLTTQEMADVQTECVTATSAIKAKTDNLPSDPADQSILEGKIDIIDTVVDGIKAKTDNLPTDPADESNILSAISGVDSKATAIQAKTDNLPVDPADQSDVIGGIAAVDNKLVGITAQTTAIKAQTDLLTFDGSNNIQARINDKGVIDAPFIAGAVWDCLASDHATFDTMGNEQSKLPIEVSGSLLNTNVLPVEVLPIINPADLEVCYRSLTGDPKSKLTLANVYGVFATYLISRLRNGILTPIASGPFTDIADDVFYGVKATLSITDYEAGDLWYFQISNLSWYIDDRFYHMPLLTKFITISPESALSAIKTQTDKLQFNGSNNIQARINDAGVIASVLARIIGLTHENTYVVNTFNIDGEHTGSVVEIYDSPANAATHDGITGLVAKYQLAVTYLSGKPISYLSTKV